MTSDVSCLVNKRKRKNRNITKVKVYSATLLAAVLKENFITILGYFATRETKPFAYHIIIQYLVIKLFVYNAL